MCKREPVRSEGGHAQRPHKGSAASLKHCRSSWVITANPYEVRAQVVPGLEAFNHVRNVKPGPERSEGPGGKAPRAFQLLLVLT